MNILTNQEFLYRQTPVNYDGLGKIDAIYGNTVSFNQILPINTQASATINGVTFTNNNDGSITANGTASANAGFSSGNWNTISDLSKDIKTRGGHKLFVVPNSKNYDGWDVALRVQGFITDGASVPVNQPTIYELPSNISTFNTVQVYPIILSGKTATNFYCKPMILDLTVMGIDNLTTVAEVESWLSSHIGNLPYYDYTQGTLIPFNGAGLKTVGKNRFDKNAIQSSKVISFDSGFIFNNNSFWTSDYIDVHGQNNITVSGSADFNTDEQWFYDALKNPLQKALTTKAGSVITIPSGAYYYAFSRLNSESVDTAQVEFGLTATSYEPYTSNTLSLPTLTYFPNGMKSAGSVYDELSDKAYTRVGSVDLGTLTWSLVDAQTGLFASNVSDKKMPDTVSNLICAMYTTASRLPTGTSTANSYLSDKQISERGGYQTYIYLKDNTYSTVEALTSALSGVMLDFVSATPTETDISEDLTYPIWNGGTEQILPINGSTPSTAPILCDLTYYSTIDTDTNIRKFWLINSKGDRWDFTDKDFRCFLNNPNGLGFSKSINATRYGETLRKTGEEYNMPQPQGELLFYDSRNSTRYEKYNEFCRFAMETPLTLYYQIPVTIYSGLADIYTLDCEIIELSKTESKTDNFLRSNIQFNAFSFYKGNEVVINGSGDEYTITNDGDFPVGFEITLQGNLVNPYITLEQNSELYGEAKFDDSTAFDEVYIDSNDGEQNVILKQSNSILPNPLSYQDLSISNGSIYVTFVKLARGESNLTIGMDSGSLTSAEIRFTPKYRSV